VVIFMVMVMVVLVVISSFFDLVVDFRGNWWM
jgi:hypothetical protein